MTIDGSVLTVVKMMEAGRARTHVREHRRLLTPMDDEDRLMSMRHLDVDFAKPAVKATDGEEPLVAIDDGSRSLSMRCPPVVDVVKPAVMKTPASRAQTSVRGHRLLVVELNVVSRLSSTRCRPVVDARKPVVTVTDDRKPSVTTTGLLLVGSEVLTAATSFELLPVDAVAETVETATDGSEPAVRRRTVPRRLLR